MLDALVAGVLAGYAIAIPVGAIVDVHVRMANADETAVGAEPLALCPPRQVPKGIRPEADVLSLGYTFKWYDIANRFTWQFLAEATAQRFRLRTVTWTSG